MDDINKNNTNLSRNLVALYAFELVAKHGNFTSAGEALGLTQSSISQRIKGLEIDLGVVLFKREHRGVSLTYEGLRLLNVVKPAMTQMGYAVGSLLERKSKPRVRISADFAFSTFWLLPRLAYLREELGDEIEIQILASTVPPGLDDTDCDIQIHVAPISQVKPGEILLLEEIVAAICSPQLLEKITPIRSSADLLDVQLLSLSKPATAEWQTWQGWFDSLGITGERKKNYISFNNYDMVTQAALAGDGVALGWIGLIDGLLSNGSLVKVTNDVVMSDAGYVMSRDPANLGRGPRMVFDWIADQVFSTPSA
ncbi:LysR family transcriptional regulator [uncultured Ruegeria sp.]|uniref:LysR family transcriptional regulator n=1 Tax=uncultured Ruegeria sp. TaxID=259304 RepID=UPI00261883C5|nr:LysR family transcriptional regulator [uncultured Ruegeria sp.]